MLKSSALPSSCSVRVRVGEGGGESGDEDGDDGVVSDEDEAVGAHLWAWPKAKDQG